VHQHWRSAAIVVFSLTVATLLTFPLRSISVHSLSLMFFAAVVVASRYAGTVAGIVTAFSSVLIFDWFFDVTPHELHFTAAALVRAAVFVGVSILVASLELQRRRSMESLQDANRALAAALNDVKILRGLLPICSYCKKIKTEPERWQRRRSLHRPVR
jgi:K+-sensing histidine kinase KdpD